MKLCSTHLKLKSSIDDDLCRVHDCYAFCNFSSSELISNMFCSLVVDANRIKERFIFALVQDIKWAYIQVHV